VCRALSTALHGGVHDNGPGPQGRGSPRAFSSVGESARLITVRSLVRIQKGPRAVPRGCSSAGRAPALQAGGRQFEPAHLHQRASPSLHLSFRSALVAGTLIPNLPTMNKSAWSHGSDAQHSGVTSQAGVRHPFGDELWQTHLHEPSDISRVPRAGTSAGADLRRRVTIGRSSY
jgi:hypothetical protein